MQLSKLFNDDKAVSPVIGVILMVAITVILAAVIGTFVLGLGDSIGDNAPSASYDWDQSGDTDGAISVTVEHVSGQSLDPDEIEATISEGSATSAPSPGASSEWDDTSISAGDSWEVTDAANSGNEIRIIWTSSGGGSSSTLTSYTVQ